MKNKIFITISTVWFYVVSNVWRGTASVDSGWIFVQSDHLKAYGLAYWTLTKGINVEWLLNYRSGAFLMPAFPIESECRIRGIKYELVGQRSGTIFTPPSKAKIWNRCCWSTKIAIYTPTNKQPG